MKNRTAARVSNQIFQRCAASMIIASALYGPIAFATEEDTARRVVIRRHEGGRRKQSLTIGPANLEYDELRQAFDKSAGITPSEKADVASYAPGITIQDDFLRLDFRDTRVVVSRRRTATEPWQQSSREKTTEDRVLEKLVLKVLSK